MDNEIKREVAKCAGENTLSGHLRVRGEDSSRHTSQVNQCIVCSILIEDDQQFSMCDDCILAENVEHDPDWFDYDGGERDRFLYEANL